MADPRLAAFLQRFAPANAVPMQQAPGTIAPGLLQGADPSGTMTWLQRWGKDMIGAPNDPTGGGNAAAPSPDATNIPALTLASQTQGPMDAAIQGAQQAMNATSLSHNLSQFTGAPNEGLGNGNFSLPGLGATLQNQGVNFGMNAVSGLGLTQNLTTGASGLLGGLMGLGTYYGGSGQQTNNELNGEIGLGLGLSGTGPNVNANVAQAIAQGLFGGAKSPQVEVEPPNAPPEGPPGGPTGSVTVSDDGSAPSSAAAASASGNGPAGAAGDPGDLDMGGRVGTKKFPKSPDGQHVQVKALPSEYVVNPEATAEHGALLEAINAGADEPHLLRLLGNRALRRREPVTTPPPEGRALMVRE